MVIGVLQLELQVPGATSLKDKRRIVRSLKDRLHREHQVSVAETGTLDSLTTATLGVVLAASDVKPCQSTLDRILDKLRHGDGYRLVNQQTQILTGA